MLRQRGARHTAGETEGQRLLEGSCVEPDSRRMGQQVRDGMAAMICAFRRIAPSRTVIDVSA